MKYAAGGTGGASNGGAGGAGGGPNGGKGGAGGTIPMTGGAGGAGGAASGGGGGGGGYEGYKTTANEGGQILASGSVSFTGYAGGKGGKGGGPSESQQTVGNGGAGGGGGDGALDNLTSLRNGSTLTGGAGGAGGGSGGGFASAGPAGTGGAGLDVTVTAAAVTNGVLFDPTKSIRGAATGGAGGTGGSDATGSVGGYGGAGIAFTATGAGATLTNVGPATGGSGGAASGSGVASVGGTGGAGVFFAGTDATLENSSEGKIAGGSGGAGSLVASDGGVGVNFAASGGMLTNTGKIQGGAGGVGGAGVTGQGMTIVDTGTIAGGAGSSSGTMADAITFVDGSNTLAFDDSAHFTGGLDIEASTATLTFDQSVGALSSDVTLADTIDGAGAVIKADTNVLTLSTTNTYMGGTTIDAGTLVAAHVGSGSTIDALGTGAVTFAGGALAIDASSTATLSNALAVGAGGGTLDGDAAANGGASATEVTGAISGSGALTFTDGTFTLSANNHLFDGAANISGTGTVLANGANTLSLDAAYTLSGGARLGIIVPSGATTTSQTIGSLAGTGAVSAYGDAGDSVSLTVGSSSSSTTYSGVITDATAPLGESSGATFALVKTGMGTLTLAGTNTYSGGTTIDGGTVAVAADANLGATSGGLVIDRGTLETTATFSSTRTLALGEANGTVQVDTGTTTTLSGTVSGEGILAKTGAGTLTLTGANSYTGGTYINAGTLSVASDGSLGGGLSFDGGTLETTATLTSQRTVRLTGAGTFDVDSGTATFSNTVSGPGALTKTGAGTLALSSANSFLGDTTIDAGTLDLERSAAASDGAITFAGSSAAPATLMLEMNAQPGSGTFRNTLTNFAANDELDLEGFTYSAGDTATLATSGTGSHAVTTLTFTDNSTDMSSGRTEQFTLGGTPATAYAVQQNVGGTGVVIEETVCFAGGTRIRVLREGREADVAVEDLVVGDVAVTASGERRPIAWLGHREIDCTMARVPSDLWPVRIRAGAFGDDRPERDLRLSPGHPVLVGSGANEHLVPIMCLINGLSIEREETPSVTYWHVELDDHDILLADNLPAESYIDLGSRPWFAGADGALTDPDMVATGMPGRCRPIAIDGPVVEAERRRVDGVFATSLSMDCAWPEPNRWSLTR